jgi:HPt (histidine-containing phosphotransfer) domain-containing protein
MATNPSIPALIEVQWTESQKLKTTLPQLVADAQERLDEIKKLIAENPELATVDSIDFGPTTTATKSVREAVWGVFNATGKFIGRNSVEAVIADTAHLFKTHSALFNLAATFTTQGKRDSNIGEWIKADVMPKLDPDMNEYAGINKGVIPVAKLYQSFGKPIYLRVNRL